jgi:hypothetical protein
LKIKQIKHHKWKQRTRVLEEENNYFREQILNLQNNIPLQNPDMADQAAEQRASRQHIYLTIGQTLQQIPQYTGQEAPDDYCKKIDQAIHFANTVIVDANTAHANTFTDGHKTDIYKSKMAGKFAPVPVQHNGNNIDTVDQFKNWLRVKYQQEMVGTQQSAITRLSQERFGPFDTPETYEMRIRPLLLGFPNNDANALSILIGHLPNEVFYRMENVNIAGINEFFTELKNRWLVRRPTTFDYGSIQQPQPTIYVPPTVQPQPVIQRDTTPGGTTPAPVPKDTMYYQAVPQPPVQPQHIFEHTIPQHIFQHQQDVPVNLQPHKEFVKRILAAVGGYGSGKNEKVRRYDEIIDYAERGKRIEETKPDDPMEIDHAILNLVKQNNMTKKLYKKPIRKVIVGKKKTGRTAVARRGGTTGKRVNTVTLAESSDEEADYEEVEASSDEDEEGDSEDNGKIVNYVKKKKFRE